MLQEDKQILWRISAVLLGIALPSMLIGKALMYGLVLIGILFGLLATKDESLRATIKLLFNNWITLVALALMAVLMLGVWTGINPAYAFEKWLQMVIVGVGSASMFITLREMPGRHLETLLKALSVATFAAAALSMLDALLGDPRLSGALHGADKALTQYRLNFMSSVLAVVLPFVWARLLLKAREGEPFAARVALPATALSVVIVLLCGGRAGWAGLIAGLVMFAWLAGRYHSLVIHARHWLVAVCAGAVGMLLYAFAYGWEFMWQRASIIGEMGQGRGLLSGRLDVWDYAVAHLLDKPFFGIGIMNYRNLPGAIDLHPHNWLLQMLLEAGFIGTAMFVVLLVMLFIRFGRYAKGNIYGVAAVASLSAFVVSGLANTSIFNEWWLTFLVFISLLGWRAGWGGEDLKKRRRGSVVVKPIR